MILTENDFSTLCFAIYLKSKCAPDEKVGMVRGIPTLLKKTWVDRLKERWL